jgi:hypothetical protein
VINVVDTARARLDEALAMGAAERVRAAIDQVFRGIKGLPAWGVLRPQLLAREEVDELCVDAVLVASAFRTLLARARVDLSILERIGVPEAEGLRDYDPDIPVTLTRLDGFGPPPSTCFVEYNTMPAYLPCCDVLAEAFVRSGLLDAVGPEIDIRYVGDPHLLTREVMGLGNSSDQRAPVIAFLHTGELSNDEPNAALIDRLLKQHGGRYFLSPVDEVDRHGGRLWVRGHAIDLVGSMTWVRLLDNGGAGSSVLAAVRAGEVLPMGSPLAAAVYDSKVSLEFMTSPETEDWFAPNVRSALLRRIPWTRRVREGMTMRRGQRVDLLPFAAEHRNNLVLKPSSLFGGKGIVLGWQVDAREWNLRLGAALDSPWVIQERVAASLQEFPLWTATGTERRALWVDACPYVLNEQFASQMLTRLSDREIVNVAFGGSFAPVFAVRHRSE